MSNSVDYDLHGIVGVRLLGATSQDVAAVDRQLGSIRSPLSRTPDIVIRFVDRLKVKQPRRLLGVDDTAFTDDAFLLLRGKHKSTACVQIPFEQVGGRCEIVCETGLAAVPLLVPILNLTALAKGVTPLHASAFVYQGVGVVATGWSKGGKTELLLSFMANGASYVGDEWVYLSTDGRVFGIPEPVTLWDWQLRQMPKFQSAVDWKSRVRMGTARRLCQVLNQAAKLGGKRSDWAKVAGRTIAILNRQRCINASPEKLFGPAACVGAARFDKLVFIASQDHPQVSVERVSPDEVGRRMVFSLQEERMPFLSYYHKFRFAFPERTNQLLEGAEDRQRELLLRAFQGKEAYAVYHPYPTPISSLYEAVLPVLEAPLRQDSRHHRPLTFPQNELSVETHDGESLIPAAAWTATDRTFHEAFQERI